MDKLQPWWDSLGGPESFLWVLALFSTTFFLIQLVLSLFSIGQDVEDFEGHDGLEDHEFSAHDDLDGAQSDHDMDHGHGPGNWFLKRLSIRTGIAYLMGMSWMTLWMLDLKLPMLVAFLIGQSVGAFAFWIIAVVMKFLMSHRSDGSMVLGNAIGKEGKVSVRIPENMSGYGKISIFLANHVVELKGMTEGPEITYNQPVIVVGVKEDKLILKAIDSD